MSLFEHFFKALSLYLEVRIRIRIKVKSSIRIRVRVKLMRIGNVSQRSRTVPYAIWRKEREGTEVRKGGGIQG